MLRAVGSLSSLIHVPGWQGTRGGPTSKGWLASGDANAFAFPWFLLRSQIPHGFIFIFDGIFFPFLQIPLSGHAVPGVSWGPGGGGVVAEQGGVGSLVGAAKSSSRGGGRWGGISVSSALSTKGV